MWVKNRKSAVGEEKEMPEQERNYLQTVREQIRCSRVHGFITEELEQHIEDQKAAFVSRGQEEETAWNNAIREMGDPVMVGQELDRAHRPKPEWSVIALTVILLIIGASVQYLVSMASVAAPETAGELSHAVYGNPQAFFSYMLMIPFGLAVLLIAYFADYTVLGRWAGGFYGGLLLAVLLVELLGPDIYGRTQYASEILLLAIPALSGCIWRMRPYGSLGVLFSFLLTLPAMLLALWIPNLLLATGIFIAAAVMIVVAAAKGWFMGSRRNNLLLSGGAVFITALIPFAVIMSSKYRRTRFLSAFFPYLFPEETLGSNYISRIARELLQNAVPFGAGAPIGNEPSTYAILPEWDTSFTLTYLISRFGLLVGVLIALTAVGFLVRMLFTLRKQKNVLGYLVSLSAFLAFGMQSAAYLCNNFGIFVLGSMSLPLISYGKLSFLVNMALIGIFLSAHRNMDLVRERALRNPPLMRYYKG